MKFLDFYLVEVQFSHDNPKHRAIAKVIGEDMVELWGNYDARIRINVSELHHFEIVQKLDMQGG